MAATIGTRGRAGRSFSARWMLSQLLSFEALFVMFLYSNEIKVLLPPLPIDETILFGAMTMGWELGCSAVRGCTCQAW